MASVGELLRRERERQGLNLAEIAHQTRIKQRYLEALERDDFESLPGRFFARSFTTQYADRLGVNGVELHDALERQVAPPQVFTPAVADSKEVIGGSSWVYQEYSVDPLPEGSASALNAKKITASVVMLLAVVVACGAIFWLWQRTQLSSTSASTASVSDNTSTTAQQTVAPPAVQPAPKQEPIPTPPPTASAVAAAVEVRSPSGRISLAIVAKEDTWLRITADGKVAVETVLSRGESRVLAASENAKILLGNAGGVDIRFNGADIGAVGPRGQVRTVDFTPEKFTVIEPQKKPVENASPQPVAEGN